MERDLGRWLIAIGGVLVLIGILVIAGGRLGLGRLPGDLRWSRGNVRVYVPLGTSLLLSIILTVVLNLLGRH
jgi:hypothetical protein